MEEQVKCEFRVSLYHAEFMFFFSFITFPLILPLFGGPVDVTPNQIHLLFFFFKDEGRESSSGINL